MNHKLVTSTVFIVCTITLFFLSYFAVIYKNNDLASSQESVKAVTDTNIPTQDLTTSTDTPVYDLPVRLVIPEINVDAQVQYMGVTQSRDMGVPSNIKDVGWYEYGANPGNVGSAVIDGHLGVGERGVFADLNKLKKGDEFFVVDKEGQKITFVVRETKIYDKDDNAQDVFYSTDGGAHLNLITCSGPYDISIHGILNRLVVFADKK
jgi:LPXTG-site transpeptidase (sortase) family protein